jgi:hypothetical protein
VGFWRDGPDHPGYFEQLTMLMVRLAELHANVTKDHAWNHCINGTIHSSASTPPKVVCPTAFLLKRTGSMSSVKAVDHAYGQVAGARNLLPFRYLWQAGSRSCSAAKADFPLVLLARIKAWLRYWRSLVWWQIPSIRLGFDPVGEIFKPFVTAPNRSQSAYGEPMPAEEKLWNRKERKELARRLQSADPGLGENLVFT